MLHMSKQELLQTASQFAGALMRDKKSNAEIIEALLDEGLEQRDAEFIVQHLLKIRAENIRREAQLQFGKGILIFLGFFILTMFANTLWSGTGYIAMLIGFGFGTVRIQRGLELKKQADAVQASLPANQSR
jgi:hypothetical protein